MAQKEHQQIFPKPGWVEHDASEIWRRTEEVIREALEKRQAAGVRSGGDRDHESARDDRGVGTHDGQADCECDRVAGHASRRRCGGVREEWRAGSVSREDGIAAEHLFQRVETALDFAECDGREGASRGGRTALRKHRYVSGLELDRRSEWRRACHGRDECQPDAADGFEDAGLG